MTPRSLCGVSTVLGAELKAFADSPPVEILMAVAAPRHRVVSRISSGRRMVALRVPVAVLDALPFVVRDAPPERRGICAFDQLVLDRW